MWWPAFGAIVVGVIGLIEPRTLGVGYDNIIGAHRRDDRRPRAARARACSSSSSWAVYLGSGTSGGTLAPLFTIGGGLGALDRRDRRGCTRRRSASTRNVAGLVGMAAMFAGASHALLASVVFAFETTRQPVGLLPLLVGCTAAYLVSLLLNRHSIMTEKLARRGVSVRTEYSVDYLSRVRACATSALRDVVTLRADSTVSAGAGVARHGRRGAIAPGISRRSTPTICLIGVLTRRDILDRARRPDGVLSRADAIARPWSCSSTTRCATPPIRW